MFEYDVVITGGGIAGSMAAVSAARLGARTLLIEENGCLGGSLTSCGTGPMMTFHAGELQVIRGVTDELIGRLVAKGLSVGHIIDSTGYTYTVTPFDAEGMKRELELMVAESGADILFHTTLSGVERKGGKITALDLLSCARQFQACGKVFVDATGDADLCYMAGVKLEQGRANDGKSQPMTMNYKVQGVNTAEVRKLMDENPALFPFLEKKAGIEKRAARLSCSGFQKIMKDGIKDGEITFDRDIVLFFETNNPGEVIVNMTRVNGFDPCDPVDLSKAEAEGRRQVWQLFEFMKQRVPGFENTILLSSGPNIGVRTSRRIVGRYVLTVSDLLSERKFEDGIACCGYPVDVHSPDGCATDTTFLREGGWYTIPYRSLLTNEYSNLAVAGRIISTDFEAQASTRLSPCCGALGQAAGTAAALACLSDSDFGTLSSIRLREELIKGGAFVG